MVPQSNNILTRECRTEQWNRYVYATIIFDELVLVFALMFFKREEYTEWDAVMGFSYWRDTTEFTRVWNTFICMGWTSDPLFLNQITTGNRLIRSCLMLEMTKFKVGVISNNCCRACFQRQQDECQLCHWQRPLTRFFIDEETSVYAFIADVWI